jgi:branched-chain amino acid transport system substrate-binding protein
MTNRNGILWGLGLVMALTILVPVAPVEAADTVKIGIMYSLTGPGAVLGKLQEEGAKLAIKDINDAGGVDIGGKKMLLEAIYRDDETKPEVAIGRLKEMVKDQGAVAVVGGTFGHVSMAVNNEAKKTKVFYMATNGVPDDFFKKDVKAATSVCNVAGGGDAGRAAASYMAEKMKAKKVVCFMPDYAIGKATLAGFEAGIKKYPDVKYEIVWHPVNSPDLTPFLIKAAEANPDVVFLGSWGGDAVNALKQAKELGLSKKAKIFHFWLVNVFATGIPPEAMDGVWAQMFWYHDMRGFKDEAVVKASQEFTDKYMKQYKNPPDPYAMTAYFGVKETARAMQLAKSTEPDKVYQALMANPDWTSVKGPAKWRIDGRPMYKYFTWIVEGKGPGARSGDRYDPSYDYAKIIDVFEGESFAPTLKEEGY